MLFSFEWLCRYVEPEADVSTVAERLTAAGLAVEGLEPRGSDTLMDVDVTTNRPDCMNHLGLAREVAVAFDKPLEVPGGGVARVRRGRPPMWQRWSSRTPRVARGTSLG